ncbi:MAG: [protein-PII] uridylyltransferase [Betaproteobacteria bacterium]|nr:[protein-PII] uridylyltransferase [Betaproteobacteria bacterium]
MSLIADSPSSVPPPAESDTRRWRETLARERALLKDAYLEAPSPRSLLRAHKRLIDGCLRAIWREMGLPKDACLAAVGGYGRGELFPYSDVDLLLLLPEHSTPELDGTVARMIGMFWDIGLEIGHSVRTLAQCLEEAKKDVTVQTNLLEATRLAGSQALFADLVRRVRLDLDPGTFLEAKLAEQQQRHARFHDAASNLEPDVKESPGGLRDLHAILWISRGCGLGRTWSDLARRGIISPTEARQLRRHQAFLENTRIRLHYLARRREDRLLFDHQAELANQLAIKAPNSIRAAELFMQQYYRTAKAVSVLNEILLQSLRELAFPAPPEAPRPLNRLFRVRRNLLEQATPTTFADEPQALFECFLTLQRHPEVLGMSAQTLRDLWRTKSRIGTAFRSDPRSHALFLAILRQPRAVLQTLRQMNRFGILGRYIPPFGRIVGQMQHDLFHVYTVDEHILMVVRNLRRFTIGEFAHEYPLCSSLISEFERPELLHIAGLFHDVAKGRGGDHSHLGKQDAERFCRTHQLSEPDTELVCFLVENHLVMSATAQKQDLSDPEVIAAFAERVGDERHLIALYLLTVADIRGTSPKVWNAWKAKLLEDLFLLTQKALGGARFSSEDRVQSRKAEAIRILRLYAIDERSRQALWPKLDTGYFLRHDAQEIAWHTRLLFTHVATRTPIVRCRLSPIGQGLQVLIYTPDQEDLFARICGFFARTHYNIVEAKVNTTGHGYALDTFLVMDESARAPHYRDLISYIEHELAERLGQHAPLEPPVQGRISRHLKHFPIMPEVRLEPDEKGLYHILSVTAGDRPGLLSNIARVFAEYKIQLHTAKITTLGERAEDMFLVRGECLNNPKKSLQFETALLQALQNEKK